MNKNAEEKFIVWKDIAFSKNKWLYMCVEHCI